MYGGLRCDAYDRDLVQNWDWDLGMVIWICAYWMGWLGLGGVCDFSSVCVVFSVMFLFLFLFLFLLFSFLSF
ncbi:hypothetical protein JB92DRAFT_2922727 [Gautieria morchelliformis]|nr:hypothetical protein JB92DRAFT_2922727 [Gautieria morchelliformis]